MPLPFAANHRGLLLVIGCALPLAAMPPRGYPAPPVKAAPTLVEHKVKRGETLWSISQTHHTSPGAIMDYNHLPNHNVREGMVLRIPPRMADNQDRRRSRLHVVRRGEDFWGIARAYAISPELLARANPSVNPNRLHEDMELIIPTTDDDEIAPPQPSPGPKPNQGTMIQHTVGDDETFYSIARRYHVSMESVIAANPSVKPERLRAGMKVWVPTTSQGPAQRPVDQSARTRTQTYIVKDGDSVASIARRYGVTDAALLKENGLDEDDPIYVDDALRIPGGGIGMSSPPPSKNITTTKAPAPAPQNQRPAPPPPGGPSNTVGADGTIRSYIVSAGEDADTICEAFGITKQQLYEYNRLAPGTRLKPGDEIAIPRVAKGRKR